MKRIILIGVAVLVFFGGDKVGAQTKEQLCAQYSADQNTYQCCMTHTSQNFEECFSEDGSSSEQLPDVPDVGEGVCAWRDANGNRCDETIQYCAEGCPPRRGVVPDNQIEPTPIGETTEEGPLAKRFAVLDKIAIPITPKGIVDFDGNNLAPEDVLRAGIDESIPSAKFEFKFSNIKKGESVNAVFSGGPPEALPIQSIIFSPKEDIDDGSLTVTIADGSRPELLGKGAPGAPDYDRPVVPPDPRVYELKDYIRVDAKIDRRGSEEYVWDGYEPVPLSEVLFKMVTSLIPKKEGFDNPETEVVFLHLNKDTQKWDPLVTEKGTECLFDESLCPFIAQSGGFSVFAITLHKKSEIQNLPWGFIVNLWILGIILFYFKFWKKSAEILRKGSKEEKRKEALRVGFKKFVFITGLIFGNSMVVVFVIINLFLNHSIYLTKFINISLTSLIGGLVFGIILFFITTRKVKREE